MSKQFAVFLCCLWMEQSFCRTITISSKSYPHIYRLDPLVPLTWHRGDLALLMASSEAVRINSKGVRFISNRHSFVSLSYQWMETPCRCSRYALCEVFGDGLVGHHVSRVFPNAGSVARVTVGLESQGSNLSSFLHEVHSNRCPETSTGRVFVDRSPDKNSTQESSVDVSLCNVVGAGGDFVFLPHSKVIYVSVKPISFQVFTVLCFLTIFMVVVLARNMELSLGSETGKSSAWPALASMVSLVFLSMFASGSTDVLAPYITTEDRFGFVVACSFVLYYVCRVSWVQVTEGSAFSSSPINPVLGTLVLVAMRVHCTLDNPYSTVCVFLLGTRLLHKLSRVSVGIGDFAKLTEEFSVLGGSIDIVVDSILVSVVLYGGVIPQHGRDPTVTGLLVVQGVFAATTLDRVVAGFEMAKQEGLRDKGKKE